MSTPATTDPNEWATYNARIMGLTAAEYEDELGGSPPVPDVCRPVPYWLSPTAELIAGVKRICRELGQRASMGDTFAHDIAGDLNDVLTRYLAQHD